MGLEFRVLGLEFSVLGIEFRVWGIGFEGLGQGRSPPFCIFLIPFIHLLGGYVRKKRASYIGVIWVLYSLVPYSSPVSSRLQEVPHAVPSCLRAGGFSLNPYGIIGSYMWGFANGVLRRDSEIGAPKP